MVSEAKIYFIEGKDAGTFKKVQTPGSFIGRESDNDIRLTGEGVSRYHAKIELADDGSWLVRDLNSSNGTKVNGEKIRPTVKLDSGDIISFGSEKIRFEIIRTDSTDVKAEFPKSPPHDDDKIETYVKARMKQEIQFIIEKLKEDKKRRLQRISIVVIVIFNLIIISSYLLYSSKSPMLKKIIDHAVEILVKISSDLG